MNHQYRVLTTEERTTLRVERVKALEADMWRAELAYEDSLSNAERESIALDIQAFRTRLEIQYRTLGILEEVEESGPGDRDPES